MSRSCVVVKEGTLGEVTSLASQIPEFINPYSLKDYEARLTGVKSLVLVAYYDRKPIGFKLGYSLNSEVFYSWFGGILPGYRRQGVARLLAEQQEDWAGHQGFQKVRVKTRNSFMPMLLFAIKSGFQIIEVEHKGNVNEHRILLEKELGKSLRS